MPPATPQPEQAARCTLSSLAGAEDMPGSAPSDRCWLLVEHAGPWGRKAVAESRLAAPVRDHLLALTGVRVQLVRRPGRRPEGGPRVFVAHAGPAGARVWAGTLTSEQDVLTLDPHDPAGSGLTPYDETREGPLLLVCTNGRRDRCCAEVGRPVATALAAVWPTGTWETTHLGGHRFAGTLLALPAGLTLGRLDADAAVRAVREVTAGRWPHGLVRGRVGEPSAAQVAETHLRERLDLSELAAVRVHAVQGDPADGGASVVVDTDSGRYVVEVHSRPGAPVRASCGADALTPATTYDIRSATPAPCS